MEGKIRLAVFGQKRLSREGGIEIVVKELCTRMAQNGCDITCYNRAGHHVSGAEYDKTIEYDGIRQKVVPTIEKKGLAAVSSSFFAALCSAFGRYDVVHIHAEGPAFFCWIPKLFGKRVISTIHGLDWAREKWKFGVGSKFIRQGEKNAVKYADEIIVLSKGVQKYFMETYGRETHFIPNGVNRPEVREAKLITDHFGLEKDSYILFLGRLVPEKGIRYLVEAFKNVKTDKKLVIAGGSSDTDSFMEELKDLAKGDDRILFTGFVQGAMLDDLEAYCDKLVPIYLGGVTLCKYQQMDYALYFGRFSEEKGIGTLIKVCKELPDVQFIFAGTGPLEDTINGVSNIKNVEFQRGEALEKLIREARFSIYPSEWYENCPFSVMESQMYGTPVLGAEIGGIPELIQVGKTGELFESGNAEDLKRKVQKLWGDKKLCEQYSKNCKDISFDTIDEYYEKIMKVYRGEA